MFRLKFPMDVVQMCFKGNVCNNPAQLRMIDCTHTTHPWCTLTPCDGVYTMCVMQETCTTSQFEYGSCAPVCTTCLRCTFILSSVPIFCTSCVFCRKLVQHPSPAVDNGLAPVQPSHGICASHQHHADQVWSLRRHERQGGLALSARVEMGKTACFPVCVSLFVCLHVSSACLVMYVCILVCLSCHVMSAYLVCLSAGTGRV